MKLFSNFKTITNHKYAADMTLQQKHTKKHKRIKVKMYIANNSLNPLVRVRS